MIAFAEKARLPSVYGFREYTEAGGLMSYGTNIFDIWRRAGPYVDKILKGSRPAEMPIEQPNKFDLVINLKTAKTLGLTIPDKLLAHRRRGDRIAAGCCTALWSLLAQSVIARCRSE